MPWAASLSARLNSAFKIQNVSGSRPQAAQPEYGFSH